MCVIMYASESGRLRPNEAMVRAMWEKNPDGGGVASRVVEGNGEVFVKWEKNLSLDEMIDRCKNLPLPFVAHFRIASKSGGGVLPELCHPFEISVTTGEELAGLTKNPVLFHNGDWGAWYEYGTKALFMEKTPPLPPGDWSDTRMIAWLSSFIGGIQLMNLIKQKGIVFGPDRIEMFEGTSGWKDIKGLLCSNDNFLKGKYTSNRSICNFPKCNTSINLYDGFCDEHADKRGKVRIFGPVAQSRGLCEECHANLIVGQPHSKECKMGNTRTSVCPECKAGPGFSHAMDCTLATYEGATGGSRPADPFAVRDRAVALFKKGKLSKKNLKKVLKRLGFHGGNRNPLNSGQASTGQEKEQGQLVDLRTEPLTH